MGDEEGGEGEGPNILWRGVWSEKYRKINKLPSRLLGT